MSYFHIAIGIVGGSLLSTLLVEFVDRRRARRAGDRRSGWL